jgi:hypothetical protein
MKNKNFNFGLGCLVIWDLDSLHFTLKGQDLFKIDLVTRS